MIAVEPIQRDADIDLERPDHEPLVRVEPDARAVRIDRAIERPEREQERQRDRRDSDVAAIPRSSTSRLAVSPRNETSVISGERAEGQEHDRPDEPLRNRVEHLSVPLPGTQRCSTRHPVKSSSGSPPPRAVFPHGT